MMKTIFDISHSVICPFKDLDIGDTFFLHTDNYVLLMKIGTSEHFPAKNTVILNTGKLRFIEDEFNVIPTDATMRFSKQGEEVYEH